MATSKNQRADFNFAAVPRSFWANYSSQLQLFWSSYQYVVHHSVYFHNTLNKQFSIADFVYVKFDKNRGKN